ncbi:MAG: SusC/RagA family TonB-linked outer membrane protein, partial [Flavisolibacter sp.]
EDGTINSADRQYAGSPWPTLQTGLQFNAIIKQFSFNLQLVGIFGNKIYNDIRRNLDSYQVTNFRSDLDPWSPTHTSGEDPRLVEGSDPSVSANNMGQSDRWLESGSYVRVRNLEIAYQLPKTLLDRANFSNGRIFISGQNLFTITKYKGLDPDVQGVGIIARGLDAGNWPSSRVISFGIVADF